MQKIISIILLLLSANIQAAAFNITEGTQTITGRRVPTGYTQYTTLTSATTLTMPAGSRYCEIQAEAGVIRYRDDGTAPTAVSGGVIASGSTLLYVGDPTLMQLIAAQAGSRANVTCYR